VLEFKIPLSEIREGRAETGVLVWWELSLRYLTRVFTTEAEIEMARHLMREYGKRNISVKSFSTPPNS
jgi:hypothetical protein